MGGRGQKPTHRPINLGATALWRRRRGATQIMDVLLETTVGGGGAGHTPKHSTNAAAAKT